MTLTVSQVLHVRNLPYEVTHEELVELCEPFGTVMQTKLHVGTNRNQAFIEFGSLETAQGMVNYFANSPDPAKARLHLSQAASSCMQSTWLVNVTPDCIEHHRPGHGQVLCQQPRPRQSKLAALFGILELHAVAVVAHMHT